MSPLQIPAPVRSHLPDDIIVHVKVIVEQSPPRALVTLALLQQADQLGMQVLGPDEIRVGTDPAVYYQVVGWDADAKALIVARIDE